MIKRVVVSNFKRFGRLEFNVPRHLVIAGPNNSGKTTLLQAIAFWSEVGSQWVEESADLARKHDGNYHGVELNVFRIASVPLVGFDHLWRDRATGEAVSVWLSTDQWTIGFEVIYEKMGIATIRPAKEVTEDDLELFRGEGLPVCYVSPLSGLEVEELSLHSDAIRGKLMGAQAGSVLRNLIYSVSQNKGKWNRLEGVVKSWFGYELLQPSRGMKMYAPYRHSNEGALLDFSGAASGFLQVLTVYASLLHGEAVVLLIDEPDAHLHILLQEKMYRELRDYARENDAQLIVATHSEVVINASRAQDLRVLAGDGAELREVKRPRDAVETLRLENTDVILANMVPGILFVEGGSDFEMLRAWARKLGHRMARYFDRPLWRETAQEPEREWFAMRHFRALGAVARRGFTGIELRDGNGHSGEGTLEAQGVPTGFRRVYWTRYEIESYLLHPGFLERFFRKYCDSERADAGCAHMEEEWPRAVFGNPFVDAMMFKQTKGKDLLGAVMDAAGLKCEGAYQEVAREMTPDEIHPEVVEKLDLMAQCLVREAE